MACYPVVKDGETGASEAAGEAASKATKKDPRINLFRTACTKWLSCLYQTSFSKNIHKNSSRVDFISCLGVVPWHDIH